MQRCGREERIETAEQSGDEERGTDGIARHHASFAQRAVTFDRVIAPVLLFVSFYVATLIPLTWLGLPFTQGGLIAVSVATTAAVLMGDRGRWPLGLFVSPRLAVPEFLFGSVFGAVLIATCALLVVLTTDVHHERGAGFPWLEVAILYLPAVVHEELLFRGYAFQKLLAWNRLVALVSIAIVFAVLHMSNMAVSWLGLTNIFLGGLLLGLAFERYGRLWFPIGLHLAWNLTSGPILGHEVSGHDSMATIFVERGGGPSWLTGGDFGIEGSVWMTAVEIAGIAFLAMRGKRKEEREKRPPP